MGLFRKKEEPQPAEEEAHPVSREAELSPQNMQIEVERLKTLLHALEETRSQTFEQISRVNEEIGEIRSNLVEREKEIQDLNVKTSKTIEMVDEVQPQRLFSEAKKQEARMQELHMRIDELGIVNDKISSEMKELRNRIMVFKDIEDIMNMGKDLKKDIAAIKKVESNVENQSGKVQAAYIDVEKNLSGWDQMRDTLEQHGTTINNLSKELSALKMRGVKSVSLEDFEKFKRGIEKDVRATSSGYKNIASNRYDATASFKESQNLLGQLQQFRGFFNANQVAISKMSDFATKAEVAQMKQSLLQGLRQPDRHHADIKKAVDDLKTAVEHKEDATVIYNFYRNALEIYDSLPAAKQEEYYALLMDMHKKIVNM